MFGKTKSLFLIVASMLCMASCDSIREDLPRCELWLEFVFDYNMEYADAFNPQVKSVDVLVFDSDDKLLFTKSAEVAALVGGSRMSLTDELDFGSYKVLTVGSLSDRFRLSDNAGNKLVPGTTTLQQVIVSLKLRTLGWYFVSIGILALGTRSISPNVTVGRANSISEAGTLNAIPFSSLK